MYLEKTFLWRKAYLSGSIEPLTERKSRNWISYAGGIHLVYLLLGAKFGFVQMQGGHIQATGFDSKGRLQYRYHPEWTDITTEMKYDDVVYFASQLPRLRKQVQRDLEESTMQLHTVAALVVRLIDLYNIRVGSDEYAKANNSYGLTTLKSMHVKHIKGEDAEGRHDAVFTFTGKIRQELGDHH